MIIQLISILIELIITILGILIALQKKIIYGWGIALTFVIYVFYDLAGLMKLNISTNFLYGLFLIATLSALWVVFSIYNLKGKRK